jgi:hypothetical protein
MVPAPKVSEDRPAGLAKPSRAAERESVIIAELAQIHHMAFSHEKSGSLISGITAIIMILGNPWAMMILGHDQ